MPPHGGRHPSQRRRAIIANMTDGFGGDILGPQLIHINDALQAKMLAVIEELMVIAAAVENLFCGAPDLLVVDDGAIDGECRPGPGVCQHVDFLVDCVVCFGLGSAGSTRQDADVVQPALRAPVLIGKEEPLVPSSVASPPDAV